MRRGVVASLVAGVLIVAALQPAAAATAERWLFPPEAEPYGQTRQQWFTEYMEWFIEIPADVNPQVDPDSARNCEVHGRVVFVAPAGSGDQGCTVPEGKAIAFTPLAHECSTAEGNGRTFRRLRRCAHEGFFSFAAPDISDLTFWIDGRRVPHPRHWITATIATVVRLPEDNVFGVVGGGPTKSITKGFFFIVKPLGEGRHELRVHLEDPEFGPLDFSYDIRVVDE